MEIYRPYTILNAAMSLDGKIATKTGDSRLSSSKDLARLHKLRSEVDGIMVGINTVIKDDPMLTVRYGYNAKPTRIIVDSSAKISLDSRIVKSSKDINTIIAISKKGEKRADLLRAYGLNVIVVGEDKVDLKVLMEVLYKMGMRKILLEGGGELNWGMLSNRLVDEIIITLEPIILGGRDSITLVEGDGFESVDSCIKLELQEVMKFDGELILRYKVI